MQCDRTGLNQTSEAASVIVSTSAGTRSFGERWRGLEAGMEAAVEEWRQSMGLPIT
jgi:hypothetical protein